VTNPPNGHNPFVSSNNGPDDYDSEEPRGHRRRRRGVAGPIVGALAVLSLVAAGGWYVTRDTKNAVATGQHDPLTSVVTDETGAPPADDATATPTRHATRTPRPTPTRTSHTTEPTTKPTTKPPAPSGSKEAQVLQLTNNERAKAGCGPLRTNSALTRAADLHATDMVVHHFFDHNSQDGRSPFDRMKAAGFTGGAMAENIAVGYSSAAAVVDGWMHSEGHRRNILNCSYTMIGIGYDSGQVKPEWGNGSWVQDFGG
jgi:uncharacterized protein YkwD